MSKWKQLFERCGIVAVDLDLSKQLIGAWLPISSFKSCWSRRSSVLLPHSCIHRLFAVLKVIYVCTVDNRRRRFWKLGAWWSLYFARIWRNIFGGHHQLVTYCHCQNPQMSFWSRVRSYGPTSNMQLSDTSRTRVAVCHTMRFSGERRTLDDI